MSNEKIREHFKIELDLYRSSKDSAQKWYYLERLHILGQMFLFKHLHVHMLMLKQSLVDRNPQELLGQLFRLGLVLPGHILHRLPFGNVGSSRVSAFKMMDIPDDLKEILK